MNEPKIVKGFKVFNPDWTCRGKTYTCPGKFEEDVIPSVCNRGMHFCKKAADCFKYYRFDPENKVAEVVAYGAVAEDGDKCCTDKLEIVREIPWAELLEIVNTGKGCTGLCNSGNRNSGNRNSGNYNSGNRNSGDFNSGDYNSGNCNSGNCNSGDYNSGNCNSGDWNKCDYSNGCFNTVMQKIYLFNKPSEWTYTNWLSCEARKLLNRIPGDTLKYIHFSDMTDEEKAAHPKAEITGGYLRMTEGSKQVMDWWRGLSDHQKAIIMEIPNFDKAIFKEITGIDVDEV